ncbi:MAG: substrate-binding domain-containing protein [Granulosicoccus sp.]
MTKTFKGEYYGDMVQRIADYMRCRGYLVVVQACNPRQEEFHKWLSLQASRCDGLIIHADSLEPCQLQLIMRSIPAAVLLNRFIQPYSERCVYLDNNIGGIIAARHLLQHGHTRIAMVTGPSFMAEVRERTKGFVDTIKLTTEASCPLQFESDFSHEGGQRTMQRILNSGQSVTAIFFQNDAMALGALDYCQQRGISVPGQYSIIGYDDIDSCRFSFPRLTSVRQPLESIGQAAAQKLDQLLTNADSGCKNTMPKMECAYFIPQLFARDSVASPGAPSSCTLQANDVQFSAREQECLEWTAQGKTSWEISVILGVAESTVSFHLRNVGKKLHSNNRTHSVALALKNGLIEL